MTNALPGLKIVDEICAQLQSRPRAWIQLSGPWGSGKTLAAGQLSRTLQRPLLYITAGRSEGEAACDDLNTFLGAGACEFLPPWEVLPEDAMEPSDDIMAERLHALNRLELARTAAGPVCLVVPVRSFLQRVPAPEAVARDRLRFESGAQHNLSELTERLSAMGYDREMMVEQRGQLSVRGGILDVFPISSELPCRIEFFGDTVESIRHFEPETQRSVDRIDSIEVLPRSEKHFLNAPAGSAELQFITVYFPENCVVAVDEPPDVQAEARRLQADYGASPIVGTWDAVMNAATSNVRIDISQLPLKAGSGAVPLRQEMNAIHAWSGRLDDFWRQLEQWELERYSVRIYCNNTGERRRLTELLGEHGYQPGKGNFDLRVAVGRLRAGFASPADRLAVLSEREMFGRSYVRRTRRRFEAGAAITAFSDVKPGDYIVHEHHGIGRYLGIKRFPDKANDFLAVQYAGKDIVYVPVTHVDQIQKYVGGAGAAPKIDRLGGASWARTKARVRKSVRDMTEELLKLYAARGSRPGHAFSPDTHWQDEFEDSFPYEETPDQARAIEEVKRDMEAPRPMDRLLCGDVGYGKTEVALRAAFKAVMDKKQVAMLVPTTILAEQHYLTFKERLADYPVTVEMLSRFRTGKEIGTIVRGLRDGGIDIVIGTHRLTSGDIQFSNLGLVILDEEQRFGVRHKERLKQLKTNVDVLTMTATPIPRTLHLSLSGVRDMSIINTAPNDRLPIHTCIEVFDERHVKEAVQRELNREGQIYYLHNRVQTIDRVAAQIQRLVPEARIGVGHGQLPEHELEEVMARFIRHELDVLVCTTIIGSGLDIPNANTIIVDRADRFGLAELYQIRGRVGRYKHRAFAYLLIPGDKALTQEAQQRLKALEEFSTLGAGFRIAMRDLEIRGCGNILGGEQSGHIAAVGYETYTQLVAEAVAEVKGEPQRPAHLPPFDINTPAYIPDEYVPIESQKITLYKRIASLMTIDDVDAMREELTDRFGPPPDSVAQLLHVMEIRARAAEAGVARLTTASGSLLIEFRSAAALEAVWTPPVQSALAGRVTPSWENGPALRYALNGADPVDSSRQLFSRISESSGIL